MPEPRFCRHHFGDTLGLAGLGLFAFGYVGGKAIANVGLGLLLLAFCLAAPARAGMLLKDGLVRLGLVWMAYALGLAAWATQAYPNAPQFPSLPSIWSFAFIPLVALATRGDTRRSVGVLLVALGGILYKLARDIAMGIGPPDHYDDLALGVGRNLAVLFIDMGATGCLLALFAPFDSRNCTGWKRWLTIVAALMTLLILLYAWIAAASRTSLVALPLIFAAILLGRVLTGRRAATLALSIAAILVTFVVFYRDRILEEVLSDGSTWARILAGQWTQVPSDSATGLRFHMWHLAYEHWLAHPLTGLGPNVADLLSSDPSRPYLASFTQYHSGYVEILLRTGLIGVAAYATAALIVWRASSRAYSEGRMPRALFELLLAGFAIFATLNLTNAIMFFQQGWQFIVLFGGIAYGYKWADAGRTEGGCAP